MTRLRLHRSLWLLALPLLAACEPAPNTAPQTRADTRVAEASPQESAAPPASVPAPAPPPTAAEPPPPVARAAPAPEPAPAPAPEITPEPTRAPTRPPPPGTMVTAPPTVDAGRVAEPTPIAPSLAPSREPEVLGMHVEGADPATGFAGNAFPPTLSDREWHRDAWIVNDCLRCHETGVGDAPAVRHRGLTVLMLEAKCRTCHVLIPGQAPRAPAPAPPADTAAGFASNAFPPMIPDSGSHLRAWTMKDCMLCHETGVHGAPIVRHRDLPELYLRVKCRTCHVQVRSHATDRGNR